ncbi:MAG: hypothetical protein JXR84_09165 [Anaerolineae bacterium]|nr:hypothetical protein [Anaerolineae bacterium]
MLRALSFSLRFRLLLEVDRHIRVLWFVTTGAPPNALLKLRCGCGAPPSSAAPCVRVAPPLTGGVPGAGIVQAVNPAMTIMIHLGNKDRDK